MDYQVIWNGPVWNDNGIGIASREYALALHRQGVDVKIAGAGRKRSKAGGSLLLAALSRKSVAGNKIKVLLYNWQPHTLNFVQARKKYDYIILNTVWETTRIPRNWLPAINKFDAVCVPSSHNVRAMRNSGVRVPVFVVPHGVHSQAFTPNQPKYPLKLPKGTFRFVSVFTFQHRKNPETLLRAYWEAFSSKDRIALIIKTRGFGASENGRWIHNRIRAYKRKLGHGRNTAPLYVMTGKTNLRKLKGIYTLGHAFVLPTRGEGVGLPFLESLSSGRPVIATAWGGQMDFLSPQNSFLVDYKLRPPSSSMHRGISRRFRNLFSQSGQLWAEPDLGSLKRQMRYAYTHPELCRQKGLRGRQDIRHWSWNRAGFTMKQAIEHMIRLKARA